MRDALIDDSARIDALDISWPAFDAPVAVQHDAPNLTDDAGGSSIASYT